MKTKILISVLITFVVSTYAQSDYRSDVYTPNGSLVEAWIMSESSSATRNYFDTYFTANYPNAQQIKTYDNFSATRKFNCHGYAWHRVETGQDRWIGYSTTSSEDIYMTDGSYTQVIQETFPGKVSWGSGDHSAVTTEQTGWFISKWNEYPLMRHRWDDTPYGTTNLKYYIKLYISGPSEICSQSTYTISGLPTGATVAWTYSSNLQCVQIINGNITLAPINGGSGTINATISVGSTQIVLPQKTVWVGPQLTLTGSSSVNYLGTGSWTAIVNCGIPPYFFEWYLRKDGSGANALCVAMGDGDLTLRSVQAGSAKSAMSIKDSIILNQPATYTLFYLYARVTDGNGIHYQTSEQRIHAHGNVDLVPDYLQKYNIENQSNETDESKSITVFPNPTSEYITVEINEKDFETVNENIDIIVFDKYMNKIKVLKTKSRETSINISDCKAGIYFVQVQMSNKQWMNKVIKQ